MCPYTLDHNKMLASTMQHSTHNHTPNTHHHHHTNKSHALDGQARSGTKNTPQTQVSSQDPTVCQAHRPHRTGTCSKQAAEVFHPATPTTRRQPATSCLIRCGISERRDTPQPTTTPTTAAATKSTYRPHQTVRLLRKEVIQPHLPVRLPCYDFVPIASPTFDDSPRTSPVRPSASGVTNFRDVTGGVYKARERIHRSVADLRLLATPTSRGRVADPDPN
jgi:hypothetical protein